MRIPQGAEAMDGRERPRPAQTSPEGEASMSEKDVRRGYRGPAAEIFGPASAAKALKFSVNSPARCLALTS